MGSLSARRASAPPPHATRWPGAPRRRSALRGATARAAEASARAKGPPRARRTCRLSAPPVRRSGTQRGSPGSRAQLAPGRTTSASSVVSMRRSRPAPPSRAVSATETVPAWRPGASSARVRTSRCSSRRFARRPRATAWGLGRSICSSANARTWTSPPERRAMVARATARATAARPRPTPARRRAPPAPPRATTASPARPTWSSPEARARTTRFRMAPSATTAPSATSRGRVPPARAPASRRGRAASSARAARATETATA